ncbi:glycoside hydrolase family 95 protein [Pedobacter borealis]|uniref:glycoside hydrolase family 95 protein n=1 Tax=Pedobacter borealis TaxID=475254 RepID=UPI00068F6F6A|nr:glycoside hydrolase family 95 protein [Pedobacter borealis]
MKKNLFYFLLVLITFCTATKAQTLTGQANAPAAKLALWYRTPATDWMTSALPIGNGRIGAMIFGGISQEHVQFNDKTLWTGSKTVRGAYQNFGDIYFDFPNITTVANYRRQLDLENAISTVSYEINGVTYTREYFCSYPDNVIVMRFSSTGSGNISFDASMQDTHSATPTLAGKKISIAGNLTLLSYEATMSLNNDGGTTSINGDKISVNNANSVTIILSAGTNYDPVTSTYLGVNAAQLHTNVGAQNDLAAAKTYSNLRSTHIADYQTFFNRTSLNLNDTKPTIPTNELRTAYNSGIYNSFLDVLYFQYGRYLMLGSARGMALPSNLQGLWCNSNTPPWQADIHSNINVEMNYWPAEITNLSELHATFNDYIYNEAMVQPSWRAMATSTGNSGWTMKTQNNIFGYSDWEWNQPANAWYCMHLWQHYAFTLDQDFLTNKAYPVMKSACDFWLSRLITDSNGKLVAPNEWSPEHGPRENGIAYAQQLIWDLFTNTIKASETLNTDASYRTNLQAKLALLDNGIVIGSRGQLREWKTRDDDPTEKHRHLSNFMALYPGKAISPLIDQTNADAAKVALIDRGDSGQSWSTAWKISAWSRLLDGNHAHSLVKYALTETYENLFSVGPPFQIDGNFGTTAGITEMLLQSHLNKLQILPAVPTTWPTGSVSGLKAMGNFTVGLNWNSGSTTTATIYSGSGSKCTIYYKNIANATVKDGNGNTITFNTVSPNEIDFPTTTSNTYTISNINFQVAIAPNAIEDGIYKLYLEEAIR